MGIFKSKKEREIERRVLIKKTMSGLKKHIEKLEVQKQKYLETAKYAKSKSAIQQYNLAISGIKGVMTQQKRAEEMLITYELMNQMRDTAQITSSFLDGMSTLSKEMIKITKDMDFVKVQSQFERALQGAEETEEKMDMLMDTTSDGLTNLPQTQVDLDKQIEALVDKEIAIEQGGADTDIDKEIADTLKSIKEEISANKS